MRTAIWFGLILLLAPMVGNAASFDCRKAKSEVEKLICSESKLSSADDEMDRTYRTVLRNRPKDRDHLTKEQKRWLKEVRDVCRDTDCLRLAYFHRNNELQTQDPFSISYDGPVRIEDLGENWQFARDADKLPVIGKALAGRKLVPPIKGYNKEPICKAFPKDLIAGRNIEVIEPEIQILDANDPRLGGLLHVPVGDKVEHLDRDDPRVGRWHRCDGIDVGDSAAKSNESVFQGLGLDSLLPYRFYRLELDSNSGNGPEDVVMYRLADDGYAHIYRWIDLQGCEIRGMMGTGSPRVRGADYKDALSLMIHYRGKAMVLTYTDWSKDGEAETTPVLTLQNIQPPEVCSWQDPRLSVSQ